MNTLTPAITIVALIAAAAPALAESRTYDLAPFEAARIETSIKARIEVGGPQAITAEAADPAVLDDLRIEVVNGEFHAWVDKDVWDLLSFRDNGVKLTITVPHLSAISATSSADVEAVGITTDTLRIDTSSSANVRLTDAEVVSASLEASSSSSIKIDGTCTSAEVKVSSSADVDTARLACARTDIHASSSSHARVFASDEIDLNASSSARVEILGGPEVVHTKVSSGAEIDIAR